MSFITDVEVAADGHMVLPQAVRDAMGVSGETRVVVSVEGSEVRLSSTMDVVVRLQALYRAHATHDADSAAFLQERRRDEGQAEAGET